jgi:hypothetical protein
MSKTPLTPRIFAQAVISAVVAMAILGLIFYGLAWIEFLLAWEDDAR